MRTKESGSLVTFLVVGLALAALVIGGVYTLQKKPQQPLPSPVASTPTDKKPTSSPSSKPSTAAPASPRPTPSQKPKASPSPVVPSRAPSPSNPKGNPLPETGPSEDFLASTLVFAGLVGTAVAYVRSRNALRLAQQVD